MKEIENTEAFYDVATTLKGKTIILVSVTKEDFDCIKKQLMAMNFSETEPYT